MVLAAEAVDDVLDPRVQELDDQHDQARTDEQRALDGRSPEPEAGWHEHDAQHQFLAEGCLVTPCGAKAGDGKERGIDDTAEPRVAGFSHDDVALIRSAAGWY